MPQICGICRHPERLNIEAAMLRADSFRKIATRYGTSTGALVRHKKLHIAAQLAKARELADESHATTLLDRLKEINAETRRVLTRAIAEKNGDLALKAISRLEKQLELEARLIGELQEIGVGAGGTTRIEVTYVDKQLVLNSNSPTFDGPSSSPRVFNEITSSRE